MKKYLYFVLTLYLSVVYEATAQKKLDIQGSIKIYFDINLKKVAWLSNSRIVASFNPILYPSKKNNFFISASPSFSLQTGRGIAMSMADEGFFKKFRSHAVLSLAIGHQWGDNAYVHSIQNATEYLATSYLSKQRNVVAIASNLIYELTEKKYQTVGNIFLGFSGLEFSYLNDGPPFCKLFADMKDRWWTGSGYLGFVMKQQQYSNKYLENLAFRLSYDRYTGYTENAFELADALKMDYSLYGEAGEHMFNRGSMRLGVFSSYGSVEICANDVDELDVQYWLHKTRGQSLHRTINEGSTSIQVTLNSLNYLKK